MDDDLTFGTSVWGSSDPVNALPPPTPTTSFHVDDDLSFDDAQFSDDFDNFATPAESVGTAEVDNDFGDFGDFGEAQVAANDSFNDADFGERAYYQPLELDPLPSGRDLQSRINEILGPSWADNTPNTLTDDNIREVEGIGQMLVTPESREIYKMLQQPPSIRPSNWKRSRIRRQHLISLGIPVNLDEVLPHANGKPLPPLQISSRPMSAPPPARSATVASNSRAGTPQPAASHFGPKPELDHDKIDLLLSLDAETLNLLPLVTLERRLNDLRSQTALTSALLTHLLQTRESLQQDSEMYNRLIAELVGEAQRLKSSKPSRTSSLRR